MPPFTTTKQEAERLGAPATGQGRTAAARDRNPPKPTTCPKSKAQTLPKPPKTARHDVTVPQRGAGQGGTLPARRNTPGAPRPPRATLRQSGARYPRLSPTHPRSLQLPAPVLPRMLLTGTGGDKQQQHASSTAPEPHGRGESRRAAAGSARQALPGPGRGGAGRGAAAITGRPAQPCLSAGHGSGLGAVVVWGWCGGC